MRLQRLWWSLVWLLACGPTMLWAGPHTVQRGETFADIARLYHVDEAALRAANPGVELHTGYTVDVPLQTLFYDLGQSTLFRRYVHAAEEARGAKLYQKGHQLQLQLSDAKPAKQAAMSERITDYYQQALVYGSVDALYQLGRRWVHGRYYADDDYPTFAQPVTSDVAELQVGVEYLQIATLCGRQQALVELAVACGRQESPIHNAYLCLEMLQMAVDDLNLPVGNLVCYMYEQGYGINRDYLQAYLHCPEPEVWSNYTTTHRERILEQISHLSVNFETSKYGVGMDTTECMAVASAYMRDTVMQPEGLFWLHRAALADCAQANWWLAALIQNPKYRSFAVGRDAEAQYLHFARRAARLGHAEAQQYIAQYDAAQQAQRERAEEEARQRQLAAEQRRQERRARWGAIAATVINAAAQTAMTMAAYHEQQHAQAHYASSSTGSMSVLDPRWFDQQMLAMQQLAQYTLNKGYADWTGTPMVPTDMSAVNFGTDMSPGSPAWMFQQHQMLSTISMQNTRMQCEQLAALRYQVDQIEQYMAANPTAPIAGYYDRQGNWISADMVTASAASGASYNSGETSSASSGLSTVSYGEKVCHLCAGSGQCSTCNGSGYQPSYLATGPLPCANCKDSSGRNTGRCSACGGSGKKQVLIY